MGSLSNTADNITYDTLFFTYKWTPDGVYAVLCSIRKALFPKAGAVVDGSSAPDQVGPSTSFSLVFARSRTSF